MFLTASACASVINTAIDHYRTQWVCREDTVSLSRAASSVNEWAWQWMSCVQTKWQHWRESCLTRVLECSGWSSPVGHSPESQLHTARRTHSSCHQEAPSSSSHTHKRVMIKRWSSICADWPAGRCRWAGRNPPPVWSQAGTAVCNLNTQKVTWSHSGSLLMNNDDLMTNRMWTHSGHRCHLSKERLDSNTCRSLLPPHTCHLNTTHIQDCFNNMHTNTHRTLPPSVLCVLPIHVATVLVTLIVKEMIKLNTHSFCHF